MAFVAVQVFASKNLLSAGGIESARLCLLSDPGGPGLGNSSGRVGRTLMYHYQTAAIGIYRQSLHGERGHSVTSGFAAFMRSMTVAKSSVMATGA